MKVKDYIAVEKFLRMQKRARGISTTPVDFWKQEIDRLNLLLATDAQSLNTIISQRDDAVKQRDHWYAAFKDMCEGK